MGFTQASQSAAKWTTAGEGRVGRGGLGGWGGTTSWVVQ